ncbi:MAG: hypothetical protein R2744_10140 [Bacteroidales bacterium]
MVVDTMLMEITGGQMSYYQSTYLERYDDLRVSPHRKPAIALRMLAADLCMTKTGILDGKGIGQEAQLRGILQLELY